MRPVSIAMLIALLVLAGLASAGEKPVRLAWKPEPGQVMKYKNQNEVQGEMGLVTIEYTTTVTIPMVTETAVTVESKNGEPLVLVNGEKHPGVQVRLPDSTSTYAPDGTYLASEGESSAAGTRLRTFVSFVFPEKALAKDDRWDRVVEADADAGIPAGKITFTYQGVEAVEGHLAHKVAMEFQETEGDAPMSGRGTFWISPGDGSVVKSSFDLKNVNMGMVTHDMSTSRMWIE